MSDNKVSAQGLMDTFFLDKETVNRAKEIIMAIDPDKIKAIMNALEIGEDGRPVIKIDLSVKV